MHIKQGSGGKSRHLKNAIEYIMNPKKTQDGILIGGNSGSKPAEVYQAMMETKRDWDKLEGRQGYHYVLSFSPGETDVATAYQIMNEFCEAYLGDAYDYIFTIHDDQHHMHGHLIFNSVNRISGYKYRYEKGDWEKYIQPITDRICKEHGLPPLEFENEKRKGRSYAQWEAEKNKKPTWKKIIRADIDYVITISKNEEAFVQNFEMMGYEIRKGQSEKHGTYFAFRAKEQNRAWRSYNLGEGYQYSQILSRLSAEKKAPHSILISPKLKACRLKKSAIQISIPEFQKKRIRSIYFFTYRQRTFKNPYAVDYREVRKSILHIDQLWESTTYLLQHQIKSYDALLKREEQLKVQEKSLKNQKYSTDFFSDKETYQRYVQLKKELANLPEWDDAFEEKLDELEKLEMVLPDATFKKMETDRQIEEQLRAIREEKKIIRHIKKEEAEDQLIVTKWGKPQVKQEEMTWKKLLKENGRSLI